MFFAGIYFTTDELDHVASLERAAHTTLHLVQELKSSTAEVTSLTSVQHKEDTVAAGADNNTASGSTANNPQSSASSLPNLRAPLPDDTDKAQFLMKLAPRIRRLEADTVKALTATLEDVLGQMKSRKEDEMEQQQQQQGESSPDDAASAEAEERDLLMIGHCLRGLALLGRGKEAEGAFARVAIM